MVLIARWSFSHWRVEALHLYAEDGTDAGCAGGLLEGHRAVQAVGIREGQGGAGHAPGGRDQGVDAVGAGEKGIVAVAVQMDEHDSE